MANNQEPGDSKKYTLMIVLSFATVFCLLMLMRTVHGPFKVGGGEHHGTEKHEPTKAEGHH
jgi:hypothetical protein